MLKVLSTMESLTRAAVVLSRLDILTLTMLAVKTPSSQPKATSSWWLVAQSLGSARDRIL